jgi:hypothetical protein
VKISQRVLCHAHSIARISGSREHCLKVEASVP